MYFELEQTSVQCPYCWESFTTTLDCSALSEAGDSQQYTEDCYVCCRPIVLTITLDEQAQPTVVVAAELG